VKGGRIIPYSALVSSVPELTIAATRFDEPDEMVLGCLRAVARQIRIRGRVLFLDQRPDADLDDVIEAFSTAALRFERQNIPARGIAHARNLAIAACRTDLLLFLDPDMRPEPDWAAELVNGLASGAAAAVSGRVLPRWLSARPYLARSRSVQEMYSILDHGEGIRECRKLMGGSLGIHLPGLGIEARFDESLGRILGRLASGEDQEFADRLLAAGGKVLYCGRSVSHHLIPPERCRVSWLLRRVCAAGFDRGQRGQRPRPTHRMQLTDRLLVLPLALPYAWGLLRGVAARRKLTDRRRAREQMSEPPAPRDCSAS